MNILTFENLKELENWTGKEIGPGAWTKITQKMVNDFASATGDRQWIHVDQKKAAEYSPFGGTIAHGFLTLSLIPRLISPLYHVKTVKMAINYGVNRVRFVAPVPTGAQVRIRGSFGKMESANKGLKLYTDCYIDLKGADRPACFAQLITVLYE